MKITKLFLLLGVFVFTTMCAYGYDSEKETGLKVPAGMEIKKVGNVNAVVPKGTEVTNEGGAVVIESTSQYVSRKLEDLERRIDKMEAEQEKLQEEIKELKERLSSKGSSQGAGQQ